LEFQQERKTHVILMKKAILYLFCMLLFAGAGIAQDAKFITYGRIEYEKRTNQHALLEEENIWEEMMKDVYPKFAVTYFDLVFDSTRSLYKTGRDPENKMIHWGLSYITNTFYRDNSKQSFVHQKNIFGTEFLITDSLPVLEWKITNEPRTIAGFECRKAVSRINDSIVVIAFYTDEIIPASGPESFGGLPGMILGLAIPRMHTTWYATKLELVPASNKELAAPAGGKKFNAAGFRAQMNEIIADRQWLKKLSWQLLI
jgi:GLPGLI family protein